MTTANPNLVPTIGQIVVGERTQLYHYPSVPYADRSTASDVITNNPTTGQVKQYINSTGLRNFNSDFVLTTDKDNLVTFFEQHIEYGLNPFLYMVKPLSNWTYGGNASASSYGSAIPPAHWVHLAEPGFSITKSNDSPYDFSTSLSMTEIAPYYTSFST